MAAQTGTSHAAEIHNHLRKAAEYLKAKDPDSAVKEFDAVLALDPKNAEAYANLGVVAFFRRDYLNASQYLHKAVVIDPSLVKSQALLGICERRLGDPSARALLEKSFSKLKDKSLRLQVGLELASLYDQQGETGALASIMQSLVDLDPDNVDVLFMAQRVYSELADDTLNKLAIVAPGSARMQQVIAEHLVNEGDLPRAIEHYKKALQIDPRLTGVHFELGEAILQSAAQDPRNSGGSAKRVRGRRGHRWRCRQAGVWTGRDRILTIRSGSRIRPLPASLQTQPQRARSPVRFGQTPDDAAETAGGHQVSPGRSASRSAE